MPLRLLIIFLALFCALSAHAFPDFIQESGSHYIVRSLGSACFSMTSVQYGLPCNPAAIALDQKASFDSSIFAGSDLSLVDMVREAMDEGKKEELYKKAATTSDVLQAEASLSTSLMGPTRGISVDPYRLVYYSRVENPTLPFIDVVAAEQRSITGQLGSFVQTNWAFGMQFRYTHIKVIERYFAATEVLAEKSNDDSSFGDDNWESAEVDQFAFEPGLLYQWQDRLWEPQVTAAVTHLGWSTPKSEAFPLQPQFLLGGSLKPSVPVGVLETALQLQMNSEVQELKEIYRLAVGYTLGHTTLTYSYADRDQATALFLNLGNLNLGFAYRDEHIAQSVFLQGGYRL